MVYQLDCDKPTSEVYPCEKSASIQNSEMSNSCIYFKDIGKYVITYDEYMKLS